MRNIILDEDLDKINEAISLLQRYDLDTSSVIMSLSFLLDDNEKEEKKAE